MATNWKEIERQYYMQVVRRQPVVIVRGKGTTVWDDFGKEYLDFTAGWAVNNVGHSNSEVAEAIANQAQTLLQTSNQFFTIPQLDLAQLLIDNSCMERVFFCNSGAEANEGAIKLAKKYGKLHLNGAYEIITALNSFHGRTMMNVSATGQPHYQQNFTPIPAGFTHVDFGDIEGITTATTDRTVAVMLEPVQGEGGVRIPPPNYLKQVREWCDEKNLLLIFDEVQTGMGRLGTLFGYQSFGVEPDIITLAKALGGGVPIGAFLANEKAAVFEPGDHGSTFGGNALTCAAAHAATKYTIENNLSDKASHMGEILGSGLEEIKRANPNTVADVRGMGLLWAIEYTSDISASVMEACNKAGLLLGILGTNGNRLMPPLTVSKDEINTAMERLDTGLKAISN
ncbi:aspartate aminotransferase family protein [Dehalococcoidia bacterium]|jgi:predicted acetylornithine/succinylornithine family transaminase|nr:aspartate aminotransferase family protein [Dehalococcoidia bacterium]